MQPEASLRGPPAGEGCAEGALAVPRGRRATAGGTPSEARQLCPAAGEGCAEGALAGHRCPASWESAKRLKGRGILPYGAPAPAASFRNSSASAEFSTRVKNTSAAGEPSGSRK
jgi:hypothetical protein